MSSSHERRKGLRAALPTDFFFNVLGSAEQYARDQTSVLLRLSAIDALKVPTPKTESQILLSKIDQKLSLLIGLMVEKATGKSYTNHAVVVDISEFGLGFTHDLEIAAGTYLEIGLHLPTSENVRLLDIAGRVVRATKNNDPAAGGLFAYGVEFTDIMSKDQNEIVQWIFTNQREQIRRRREQS